MTDALRPRAAKPRHLSRANPSAQADRSSATTIPPGAPGGRNNPTRLLTRAARKNKTHTKRRTIASPSSAPIKNTGPPSRTHALFESKKAMRDCLHPTHPTHATRALFKSKKAMRDCLHAHPAHAATHASHTTHAAAGHAVAALLVLLLLDLGDDAIGGQQQAGDARRVL